MDKFCRLLAVMLLIPLVSAAQLTVGNRVMSETQLTDNGYYIIYQPRNAAYVQEPSSGTYVNKYYCPESNSPADESFLFHFLKQSDGTYKIKNVKTGNFMPTPSAAGIFSSTTEASAGSWNLQFDATNGAIFPLCNGFGWDRGSSQLWATAGASTTFTNFTLGTKANASVKQYVLYEVISSKPLSELDGKDVFVQTSDANTLTTDQWYVMFDRGTSPGPHGYLYENTTLHTLFNTATAPSGSSQSAARYLVRLSEGDTSGKYYVQNGLGNYFGLISHQTNVPVTGFKQEQITIGKIASTDGHFYLQGASNVILDANDIKQGDATVVGWGTSVPTSTGGNNDWAFYPVDLAPEGTIPVKVAYGTSGETVYGTWDSNKTTWTSQLTSGSHMAGLTMTKSGGAFNKYSNWNGHYNIAYKPSAANTDDVITLTAPSGYVIAGYSMLAAKASTASHTYTLKAADGTSVTPAYASNANAYTTFTVSNLNTKSTTITVNTTNTSYWIAIADFVVYLQEDDSGAVVGKALSSSPTAEGWYAIKVQSSESNANAANNYLYTPDNEINYNGTYYPLSYRTAGDLDATYFFHLTPQSGTTSYWQMPNGRFLVNSGSKFPVSSVSPTAIEANWKSSFMYFKSAGYYAVAYNLSSTTFVGETTTADRTKYDVYPINLDNAGLTPWKVVIEGAPTNLKMTCKRSDVNGLSSVYNNGYFFLPSDVTPASSDFSCNGIENFVVDATNKTVTAQFPAHVAITQDNVSIAQGFQTASRDAEVLLLRVTASPVKDATEATLNISLKDGSENQISKLTLYEASSNSTEVLTLHDATAMANKMSTAPSMTQVGFTEVSGASAVLPIGTLTAGTHYYWVAATLKADATLGSIVDAAVTGITYTCNAQETTLDLSSIGDPSDRGAMVFNTRTYPFLPSTYDSRVYRIPAMVVADDGSIVVAADKRYQSYTDIGGGHVIDIVVRRSTDGGKTWSNPVVIAKGQGTADNDKCGYGDPSLIKGKDGKIYCFYAAGNTGYFYGLSKTCMSVSTDNGQTWDSSAENAPVELAAAGRLTDHASSYGTNTAYGLFDWFVTSGRGICTSEGYLMALAPAQAYTNASKTNHTGNSQDYIFYSTDEGATWHFSKNAIFTGGDEAKITQANDGSLLASVRQGGNRGFNTATYTKNADGTLTFTMGTQWNNLQLNAGGYANNQDILYYQRGESGKDDVIIHSMTTGQHANLKLYYSKDGGHNWTEFLNVQTKGTRYVTMDRNSSGSLYLFFEDQSLNSAGGYTDYNHYPLNFLEITRDQLEDLIPDLTTDAPIKDGKVYRIINKYYSEQEEKTLVMGEVPTSHKVTCVEKAEIDYTQLWVATVTGSSIQLCNAVTGRYIQLQGGTQSTPYMTASTPASFTYGYINEVTPSFYFEDANSTGLHCRADKDVVGWNITAGASEWLIEEVTPIPAFLDMQRQGYQEMMEMVDNATAYNALLENYFTDGTCTELKDAYASMDDAALTATMTADGLPAKLQSTALKVKNNTWTSYNGWDKTERTFRVADYKAYGDYWRWTNILKTGYNLGRLTNPTGIYGTENETVMLHVGTIPAGQTVALEVVPEGSAAGTQTILHEGFNPVVLDQEGSLFIYHSVNNTTDNAAPFTALDSYAPVTVHIEGGTLVGYFDLTKGDDNDDWAQLKTHLAQSGSVFDVKSPQLTFHINREALISAVGSDMTGLLNTWEAIITTERNLQGLEEYENYFNNPLSVTSVNNNYMYATNYGTYYEKSTLSTVLNPTLMKDSHGAIWGPAHEMGHIHQRPINMIGCTEISNNVFSNVAVYNQGRATSRTASIRKTFDDFASGKSWLDRVYNETEGADLWQGTHLYWQLYQYFHIAGFDTDFYPNLYKAFRQSPMNRSAGTFVPATEDYLKFYKTCCQVSGFDLTEFFDVYGFFTLPTEQSYTLGSTTRNAHYVGDYGDYYVYTTQEMIDQARAEVKAMKLRPCSAIFIEDRITAPDATYEGHASGEKKVSYQNGTGQYDGVIGNCGETGQYTEFDMLVNGEYTADVDAEGNVSISGGTGAVGFKVYDANGKLVMVANVHNFQLPSSVLANGYTLVVVQGDGGSVTISPLYRNVLVNYAAGGFYTTLYVPVAIQIPENAKAFAATLNDDVLTLRQYDSVIPAGEGALIEFLSHPSGLEESFRYDFTPSIDAGTPIAGNRLTGSYVDTDPRNLDGTIFTFAVKSGQVGFYKYTGTTLKAGKAFLLLTGDEAQNVRGFAVEIPTGIYDLSAVVGRPSPAYDLQGRRLNKDSRRAGIYIQNGKKVINVK